MVVKPHDLISKGRRGYAHPAVICRGPEYLRIILRTGVFVAKEFGAASLARPGRRIDLLPALVSRSALSRSNVFVLKEPLHRTQECAFGVLALESEFVDPRL
jgi:protein phosphatase